MLMLHFCSWWQMDFRLNLRDLAGQCISCLEWTFCIKLDSTSLSRIHLRSNPSLCRLNTCFKRRDKTEDLIFCTKQSTTWTRSHVCLYLNQNREIVQNHHDDLHYSRNWTFSLFVWNFSKFWNLFLISRFKWKKKAWSQVFIHHCT